MRSTKQTVYTLFAAALLIVVTYLMQAADSNTPFQLLFTNKCTSGVRVIYSYKTAGIPDFEQNVQTGEQITLNIEPQDIQDLIRFYRGGPEGTNVQLSVRQLLSNREGSNLLAVSVNDANYDPYATNKDIVEIVWQR
jgi:hypothetical protein